jgi:sugar phosphate isomerase/epimerase
VTALPGKLQVADRWPISAFGDEIAPALEEQIAVLRAEGVAGLELRSAWGVNVVELEVERLDQAARLLQQAGISVSAIGSPLGKVDIDSDFDEELSRFRAALQAAKRLQTEKIRVFSFFIPDGRHGKFRDDVLGRMSVFAREAAAHGITLVHENESYIYGDDAEHCRDLIESVGSPALQVAFDPANFVQVGVRPFDEAWPMLAKHVVHFHVKDAVSVDRDGIAPYPARAPDLNLMASVRPAGEGEGQLPELLSALEQKDYRGFLVVEPHLHFRLHEMDGAERFAVALGAVRQLLDGIAAIPN